LIAFKLLTHIAGRNEGRKSGKKISLEGHALTHKDKNVQIIFRNLLSHTIDGGAVYRMFFEYFLTSFIGCVKHKISP